MSVAVDNRKTLGSMLYLGEMTAAQLPPAPPNRATAFVSDCGAYGALLIYLNGRWRPISGSVVLTNRGAPISGIAQVETIVLQGFIPAPLLQLYDAIRVWTGPTKTGLTDQGNVAWRCGIAGTTADTQINTPAAGNWIGNSALAGGTGPYDYRIESLTSIRHCGNAGASSSGWASSYGGSSAGAQPAAVVIPSVATNGLYFSLGVLSTGATNTIGMSTGRIEWITP